MQELDESQYWLELLIDGKYGSPVRLEPLKNETNELIAILVSIARKV